MGRASSLLLTLLLAALMAPAGCAETPAPGATFTVAAAASLGDVMDLALERWSGQAEGHGAASYGASSTLARQLERGAPFDLFVSADSAWMDHLVERGALDGSTRRDLARNTLVLVQPRAGEPREAPAGRWTTGDPTHVPAGRYAQAALIARAWWPQVEGTLIPAADVRAALRLVERGEVDWGVVYGTDGAASDQVRVLERFPAESHPAIVYPAALTPDASPAAQEFLSWLSGPEGQALFEQHGFVAP